MKSVLLKTFIALLAVVLSFSTWAATFIVDDSASVVLDANLPMQWRSLAPAAGDHQVLGTTRVQVRLNTSAWVGKFGRIYMALPAQPNGTVNVKWQVQGLMLPGQLNSGQRGLVWSGVIPSALLEDVMTVAVQTDGRLLSAPQLLRFYFEVDIP